MMWLVFHDSKIGQSWRGVVVSSFARMRPFFSFEMQILPAKREGSDERDLTPLVCSTKELSSLLLCCKSLELFIFSSSMFFCQNNAEEKITPAGGHRFFSAVFLSRQADRQQRNH